MDTASIGLPPTRAVEQTHEPMEEISTAPQSSFGSMSEMRQMNAPLATNAQASQIFANNSNIYNHCTINQNHIQQNQVNNGQQPAPDESKLAYIMENRHGETVDVKIKVLETAEPAGLKRRSKKQFRGSFKVADETTYTTLKVFGPHKNEIMQLFRPKQNLILKKVKVNADCLNFTSFSTVIKSTTNIKVPETTRFQMRDEEENDIMTPEQITSFPGIAKTKVFVEKVGMLEEKTLRKKYGKKSNPKVPMRCLTVKGSEDSHMRSLELILWGKLATESYEEGKLYVFTKVKHNEKYENLTTGENCRVFRCPES